MKNYMLVATVISVISAGTLVGDYYQQQSGYPATNYESSSSRGYSQPYNAPNYSEQGNYYNTSRDYEPSRDNEYQQPQLYNSPRTTENYNTQTPQNSSRGMQMQQGAIMDPSNYTTDMRYDSSAKPSTTTTLQPNSTVEVKVSNQGVVKSNDNDKFTTDDDRRLGFQIRQKIAEKHPDLNLTFLALYVDDGSVRITGRVKNEQEKTALSNLIKEFKGVKSVNNKLEVGNGTNGSMQNQNNPLAVAESTTKYPTNVNPNSTSNWPNSPTPTTNMTSQDSLLADKIRQAIASDNSFSPQAKSVGIVVNSKNITLNGTVNTDNEKSRLTSKVKSMSEGRVINNMVDVNSRRR